MKFNITLPYSTPGSANSVKVCEAICIRDPQCAVSAMKEQGADVRILKHRDSGSRMELKLAIHPHKDQVPLPIRTFAGDSGLDYIQKTTYDFSRHKGTMETVMTASGMADTITSKGAFSLRPRFPARPASGLEWKIDGEVKANVWVVGSTLESAIVNEITSRSVKMAAHNQKWLNKREVKKPRRSLAA